MHIARAMRSKARATLLILTPGCFVTFDDHGPRRMTTTGHYDRSRVRLGNRHHWQLSATRGGDASQASSGDGGNVSQEVAEVAAHGRDREDSVVCSGSL